MSALPPQPNPELETRNSKLETQNSKLETNNQQPTTAPWPWWLEALLVAAILAVAASVRFYDLERLPPGLWFDEAIEGLNALSILHDDGTRVYFDNRQFFGGDARFGEEPLFHYLLALVIALMGPTALALRAASACVGLLTVGAFYGMVRVMWDRRMAFLAALLLAVFRWHFHFSRVAFRTILVPLFACLFFAFWWSGAERNRKSHLVIAGVLLGLGFYTYPAFPLVAAAWLCLVGWRLWREKERRPQLVRALVWPAAIAVVVLLPLMVYFAANPDVVIGRVGSLSPLEGGKERGLPMLAENLWDNIHHFWWRGDYVSKHNVPLPASRMPGTRRWGMAVFDPLTSAIFALGLIATVVGARRDWRNRLVLLWAASLACASIFSFGAPNLLRTLGMAPAVVLILTSGYAWIGRAVERRLSRATAAFVLIVLVGWFARQEIYRYFVIWRNHPEVPQGFNVTQRQLAEVIASWGDEVDVHIAPELYQPTVRYLLYGRKNTEEMRLPESLAKKSEQARDRILVYWGREGLQPLFPRGQFLFRNGLKALRIPAADLLTPQQAAEAIRRPGTGPKP